MPLNASHCPICKSPLEEPSKAILSRSSIVYSCPHCGRFQLTEEADADLGYYIRSHGDSLPYVPHAVRRMPAIDVGGPLILSSTLQLLFEKPFRPTPKEQADNLIRWLGAAQKDPGQEVALSHKTVGAIVGTLSEEGFFFVLESLQEAGVINCDFVIGPDQSAGLSFKGWERFEELRKGAPSGTTAFMAMKFGDADLDGMVETCFRSAVEATGFELRRLNDPEHQRAGLIDDRLRVEIKKSRFVISDLTHANNGAYWEAGYAEGLGKDVIYTCEKGIFERRQKEGGGTHFDTNHHLHILWETGNPAKAAEELKACIRATIPEAKQEG